MTADMMPPAARKFANRRPAQPSVDTQTRRRGTPCVRTAILHESARATTPAATTARPPYDDPSYHQPVPSGHEPRDEDRRPQEQRRGAADDCNAVGSVQESHSVFAFGGSPLRLFPLAVEEGERGARERSRHLAEDRAVAAIRYDP